MSNATDIKDMGTTGLVDFIAKHPSYRGDWQRLQKAVSVIRGRNGDRAVLLFCRAIWNAMDSNKWARNRMARQLAAFGFERPE